MQLRVWLDDDLVDRAAPDGWMQVTTAREAIELLLTGLSLSFPWTTTSGMTSNSGAGWT